MHVYSCCIHINASYYFVMNHDSINQTLSKHSLPPLLTTLNLCRPESASTLPNAQTKAIPSAQAELTKTRHPGTHHREGAI